MEGKRMKKVSLLCTLVLLLGVGAFISGCGDKKSNPIIDTNDSYITLRASYVDLSVVEHQLDSVNNTYTLSGNYGFIGFGVGIIKNGEAVTPNSGDVVWSYEGPDVGSLNVVGLRQANLYVNGSTGTITVKAQYETIFATMTIHIVL
jgi:hypothetical protein